MLIRTFEKSVEIHDFTGISKSIRISKTRLFKTLSRKILCLVFDLQFPISQGWKYKTLM